MSSFASKVLLLTGWVGMFSTLSSAADSEVESLRAPLQSVACAGDLCPSGSAALSLASDAFTLNLSSALVAGDGSRVSGGAELVLEMEVPAGFQIGVPAVMYRGFAEGAGGSIDFSSRYAFDSDVSSATLSSDLSSVSDDFLVIGHPAGLWSPTCGEEHRARLRIGLSATVADAPGALFALDTIEAALTYREGLSWRRCGDPAPLEAPPGSVGDWCGGLQRRPCSASLACELDSEAAIEGRCVDPWEILPPQGREGRCDGRRSIPCQPDLTCRHATPVGAIEGRLGVCTPSIGGLGDRCGGYPEVPCASGLSCDSDSKMCRFL